MAAVLLVAGATVGAYRIWDKATHTREDNGGVLGGTAGTLPPGGTPGADQVAVSGKVTSAHLEGVILGTLPTPFTVTPATRGEGGATFTPVDVKGESTSIDWQAGQPLPLSGDGGGLALAPVVCDVTTDGITVLLDGVHAVNPGTYSIKTSVAVGSQPRDSVTFTASAQTTVEFRGGQSTPLPTPELAASGTGTITLEGALTVYHPDGSNQNVPQITLDNGRYQIKLTPVDGGFTVTATLQGTTR